MVKAMSISEYDLTALLQRELGFAQTQGLHENAAEIGRRSIPGINSAYFVQSVPVAYFSCLDTDDPSVLRQLHQRVWSESKVPLLYVVSPHQIRVYNAYAIPAETDRDLNQGGRLLHHLEDLSDTLAARTAIQEQLRWYDRVHLDSGTFWNTQDGQRVKNTNRADQHLLDAMSQVRQYLTATDLSNNLAYTLIGRSIFIRYLESRQVLSSEIISQLTDGQATSYLTALSDHSVTYNFYQQLSARFHGDIFPVGENEKYLVTQLHLEFIRDFLNGTDLKTRQGSFWPYDFEYVPIELISGIYDTFLNTNDRRKEGTYYTPLVLVDLVLNETLSPERIQPAMTILDPACGSGIFLVRAYQRLIDAAQKRSGHTLTAKELADLLQHNIFGIDKHPEAIRIAIFSLYLALLDYLDKEQIQSDNFTFPELCDSNLVTKDFFALPGLDHFGDRKFDRIVGNLPWGRGTLTLTAKTWLTAHGYTTGGQQLAPAFLLAAPELCALGGELALLAPAKSTISVTSARHQAFRQHFFAKFHVRSVTNLSALRYELFSDTLSPTVALFYQPTWTSSKTQDPIVYAVPKPSPLSQHLKVIIFDSTEVRYLDRQELLDYPFLWKVALWGSHRDAELIKRLKRIPSLIDVAKELKWKIGEGIQIKGGKKLLGVYLTGKPMIPTNQVKPYVLNAGSYELITATEFHSPRIEELFIGPLVLIREGPSERRCAAAFSSNGIIYQDAIVGVAGHPEHVLLLKWLVAIVNSPLNQYYQFLTSSRWGVERDNVLALEHKQMPFLVPPIDDLRFIKVVQYVDQITQLLSEENALVNPQERVQEYEEAIAELIYQIYGLTVRDRQLIEDMLTYGIDFFHWSRSKERQPETAIAVKRPATVMLTAYALAFVETVHGLLKYQGQTLIATVYHDGAPLSVVEFEIVPLEAANAVQIREDGIVLRKILRRLDQQLIERETDTLYIRRHVRIYEGKRLYLIRPSENRFWTRSQARIDADGALAEWMTQPKSRSGAEYGPSPTA